MKTNTGIEGNRSNEEEKDQLVAETQTGNTLSKDITQSGPDVEGCSLPQVKIEGECSKFVEVDATLAEVHADIKVEGEDQDASYERPYDDNDGNYEPPDYSSRGADGDGGPDVKDCSLPQVKMEGECNKFVEVSATLAEVHADSIVEGEDQYASDERPYNDNDDNYEPQIIPVEVMMEMVGLILKTVHCHK